jgi:hypothetical protein
MRDYKAPKMRIVYCDEWLSCGGIRGGVVISLFDLPVFIDCAVNI